MSVCSSGIMSLVLTFYAKEQRHSRQTENFVYFGDPQQLERSLYDAFVGGPPPAPALPGGGPPVRGLFLLI